MMPLLNIANAPAGFPLNGSVKLDVFIKESPIKFMYLVSLLGRFL